MKFDQQILKQLYVPPPNSHKGQNGKLLVIGGSKLFHAASLWALSIASKIVDMVFYSSVPENNAIVQKEKELFHDGIIVPRNKIDEYITEADAILIGPGLPREEGVEEGDDDTKELTEQLLKKHPQKQWVIDGGSLQVMDPSLIPHNAILTPHKGEFDTLFNLSENRKQKTEDGTQRTEGTELTSVASDINHLYSVVRHRTQEYSCIILLKGEKDIVSNGEETIVITGGNAGMTKGGTGDVLAGLVAALACKNEPFLAALAGSFFNKKAGEILFEKVGYYFNASDLVEQIPKVMKEYQ